MTTTNIAELKQQQAASRPLADMKPKEQIAFLLNQKKGELSKMIPKTLSIDRLLKVAQIAATTTPALAKCDVPSLIGAIGQCAQMGLEPNTVLGHAYLVPFNTKRKDADGNERWVNSVQVIIGYKGLIDLARRSGQIVSIAAHEVCEADHFELVYGIDEKLNHTPSMGDRGAVVGFYAVAKLKDGGYAFEFMTVHQINQIRDASQGFQQAKKYNKDGAHPWTVHFVEMGRKTVIRRLAKYLPLSIEFQTAAALDEANASGKDQHLDAFDGEYVPVVDQETGEIQQPENEPPAQEPAQGSDTQQQQIPAQPKSQQDAQQWQPSAEEQAQIAAREKAEAGQQAHAETAKRTRGPRHGSGSME